MQTTKKGNNTDSSKIQVTEPSSSNKKHNYGRKILENSHEFHEESGHKPAENMLHHDHSEDPEQHAGEKSGHDHHEEGEHRNHEQQPYPQFGEMKHEQHKENQHAAHEQHKEIKHQGHKDHEPSRGRDHGDHHAHMLADFKKKFTVSVILTFPVLLLSPTIQSFLGFELRFPGADFLTFLLSSVVYFYGGYPFLKGIKEELSEKSPGMMTLIAVAISVAYFYSSAVVFGLPGGVFFMELVTLIDIMLLGHWLEMRSVIGASRALEELVKIMPSVSHLKDNDEIVDVGVDQLKIGDKVLVKPGEKVPVDGTIVEGTSSVNESMLTGESKPVTKKLGSEVIGGSINGEASFVVKVEKTGKDTYLSRVVELVRAAKESKSKTQDLANRAAMYLTIIALTVGTLTFLLWIFFGKELVFALERAVTVMVITCPHALGLAIPLVVAVSTSIAAKSGLLIRDRQAFESVRNLQALIFDKTGTLTEGKFGVTDIISFSSENNENRQEKERILSLAASLGGQFGTSYRSRYFGKRQRKRIEDSISRRI